MNWVRKYIWPNRTNNWWFVTLVRKYLDMLGISYEEATSTNMSKKMLKAHATSAAFKKLVSIRKTHTKVRYIQYEALEIQPYLKIELFNNVETNMLTAWDLIVCEKQKQILVNYTEIRFTAHSNVTKNSRPLTHKNTHLHAVLFQNYQILRKQT